LDMAGRGASPSSIAAALNRDGINTPDDKRWHATSVSRLLHKLTQDSD
jgi:hypothetical protein